MCFLSCVNHVFLSLFHSRSWLNRAVDPVTSPSTWWDPIVLHRKAGFQFSYSLPFFSFFLLNCHIFFCIKVFLLCCANRVYLSLFHRRSWLLVELIPSRHRLGPKWIYMKSGFSLSFALFFLNFVC